MIDQYLTELALKLNNRSQYIKKIQNQPSNFFYGIEPSGNIHLGHFLAFSILKVLLKKGLSGHFLFADLHLKLQNKTNDNLEAYERQVKNFFKGLDVSYYRDENIKNRPGYYQKVLELSKHIRIPKIEKLLPKPKEGLPPEGRTLSKIMYALLQIVDAPYLDCDLVLAGVDQRRFYAAMIDYSKKIGLRCPSVFLWGLLTVEGLKMSSSKTNVSVHEAYEALKKTPQIPQYLEGDFKEMYMKIYNLETTEEYLELLSSQLSLLSLQ